MYSDNLISEALQAPTNAIAYSVSQRLTQLFPDRALVEGPVCGFDVDDFAAAGQCHLTPNPELHNQIVTSWRGENQGLCESPANAAYSIVWQERRLEVLLMCWSTGFHSQSYVWVLGETKEAAANFFESVCEWSAVLRGEVLVFNGGEWHKDHALFASIRDATFDNLILPAELKSEIVSDVTRFFAGEGHYAEFRIPWKRGLLLVGTPGNGKTHTVKAIVNLARKPCIYVKTFEAPHFQTPHGNISALFARARQLAPCIIVFEDLDSLIKEENRAFLLNELDGFASNSGMLTLATTNHPEKLDASILERPSRFDRKYHFDLPGLAERLAYVTMWNETLEPRLKVSEAALRSLAKKTDGFSFAFLKELFLSALIRWADGASSQNLEQILEAVVGVLRKQMKAGAA